MATTRTTALSLFFDGTNNNDVEDNLWRDSKKNSHTNVARLFNSALHIPSGGIHKSYIPGVGTPFPQIGEYLYTQKGKALGKGFNQRCIWAYTQVLNAVYQSIASDKKRMLIWSAPDAKNLCNTCANGNMTPFEPYLHRLGVAHKQAVDESAWPRTVKQIWINVIGFSRGAASARAFVHKLINEWAPDGKLGSGVGKYALPYTVNFMGLFDTVASVGAPDSARSVFNLGLFDGHAGFASHGALAIPKQVRYCVHAFSIHEQRMSFPLDSIRKDDSYPDECRYEIAYPGVHSDVGGGYAPGEQGKGCDRHGKADDARKLSQIPLHDMYIAALSYGVPLERAVAKKLQAAGDLRFPGNMSAFEAAHQNVKDAQEAIRVRTEEICGQVAHPAHPDAQAGPLPPVSRPGEGPDDIVTNDKTDLRQGAEEMRLLLGYLYPEQREALDVQVRTLAMPPVASVLALPTMRRVFSVRHEHPASDSPSMSLVDIDMIKIHSARSILAQIYSADDDVVPKPIDHALAFLKQHTSQEAASTLPKPAIALFDEHIHDSRCGFRVPYFHEYAPGGYCWPRVVYVGGSRRAAWLGFDPMKVALDAIDANEAALA